MYKPFPSQQKRIDLITDFVNSKSNKKAVYVMPVAYGKSIVIANVAINCPDKYFINIAPNKELVQQNYEKYTSYGFEASLCSASLNSNEVSKVTFATIGTLKKHIDFFKDKDVVVLADEAHQASNRGGELDLFLKKIKKHKLIGVTATPMRLNNVAGGTRLSMMNRQRKCIYSSVQDVVQVSEVVKERRWSKLVYEVENVDETKLQLNTSGTDYTLKSLKAFSEANNIVEKCVESVLRLREEGRKSCIVYVPSIQEAEDVVAKLEGSAVLHSKLKKQERDRVIDGFLNGDIKTVVNVEILKQGFDYPLLSSIVIARPTNSYTLYYQTLGRAVRVHKDKKDAKVVDLSGNYNKFGAIEDLEFINEDYTEGWAAFSGDRLLTDYALGNSIVPTKQSLKENFDLMTNPQYVPQDPKFPFGKHKNKKVSEVYKTDQGYLAWITNPETNFKFRGKEGAALKIGIYRKLKLPIKDNRDIFFDKKDKEMKNKFDRFLAN